MQFYPFIRPDAARSQVYLVETGESRLVSHSEPGKELWLRTAELVGCTAIGFVATPMTTTGSVAGSKRGYLSHIHPENHVPRLEELSHALDTLRNEQYAINTALVFTPRTNGRSSTPKYPWARDILTLLQEQSVERLPRLSTYEASGREHTLDVILSTRSLHSGISVDSWRIRKQHRV